MIGTTLAHYEIEGRLGEGGSGIVYRGRDLRLDRKVAIKVLADALRDDELAWARLLREARLASSLIHPHIAAIYDLGEEDGCAYIAMEYVEGLALSDVIPFGGMPGEQLEAYAAQIGSALAFAHTHGVIHGDLKGSNIIVTLEGGIKLLDFGLGRRIPRGGMAEVTSSCLPLARDGATAGTLPYLAPEVLRGDPTSRQSDVWALGVLLYQMALGELPFQRSHAIRAERGNHGGRSSQARTTAGTAPIHVAHLSREGPLGPPRRSGRTHARARGKPRRGQTRLADCSRRSSSHDRRATRGASRSTRPAQLVGVGRNCVGGFDAGRDLRAVRLGHAASSAAKRPFPGAQSVRRGKPRGEGLGEYELFHVSLPRHPMVRTDTGGRVHDAEAGAGYRLSSRGGPGLHVRGRPHRPGEETLSSNRREVGETE